MENSRATKYLLQRRARIIAKFILYNYCVSPLIEALEVPCRVENYIYIASEKN